MNINNSEPVKSTIGEYITKNILNDKEITQEEFAKELEVSRQTVNSLIKGKLQLSNTMASRLSCYTGEDIDIWLDRINDKEQEINFDTLQSSTILSIKTDMELEWKKQGNRILVNHEISKGIETGILDIENFSENSLQPASYILRIGYVVINNPKERGTGIKKETDTLSFPPGSTATVQSLEKITRLPKYILGKLGVIQDFLSTNIDVSCVHHINPEYKGPVEASLTNKGNEPVELRYGQEFLSLELNYLLALAGSKSKKLSLHANDLILSVTKLTNEGFINEAATLINLYSHYHKV